MRTVNQIIDELGTIALDHRFINSFKEGEMSEVDIQKLAGNKYPICYADIIRRKHRQGHPDVLAGHPRDGYDTPRTDGRTRAVFGHPAHPD